MGNDAIKPVSVFTGSLWEAEVVQGLLQNAGIESFVWNNITGTIAPWLTTAGGVDSVTLVVSNEYEAEARNLIEQYQVNQSSVDE